MLTPWLEEALVRHGNRPALRHGGCSLTYGELEERSRLVALALRRTGAAPGSLVAIDLERGPEAVIAILGTLRAGLAYLPLDPRLPPRRKETLLGLARAVAVLSADAAPGSTNLSFSRTQELPLSPLPAHAPSPAQTAYALFTSGSTGQPKAVLVSQAAAYAFAHWARELVALGSGDCVLNTTGFHFDLSTFDLFAGLAAGARVVLAPAGLLTFPASLAKLLAEERVTVWYSVPSTVRFVAEHGRLETHSLSAFRALLCAGDLFPVRAAERFRDLTGCRLFNFYGPTETNVCTFHELPPGPLPVEVPIGLPAAGDQCAVLDERGALCAEGEGELVVTGPTVMTGYLGEAPLPGGDGHRAYRTGDWVRRASANAPFHLIGRRDGQVKCWGYRVHPQETEANLAALPGVREAAVIALPDPRAGHLLHGFYAGETGLEAEALLEALRERLPSPFLPATLRELGALPLTANGKIDREALRKLV